MNASELCALLPVEIFVDMLFKMAGDREEDATGKVLRGEISDLPTIEGNVVRIFLSSTFTGTSRSN